MLLPEGDYRVRLHSTPAVETEVRLDPRDSVTLTMEKRDGALSQYQHREELPHTSCEDPVSYSGLLGATPRQEFPAQ